MQVEQQAANADDFQEAGPEEEEALKRKYSIDDALENKICDLYDLYVEVRNQFFVEYFTLDEYCIAIQDLLSFSFQRLEEDSGPPVRKLYVEVMMNMLDVIVYTAMSIIHVMGKYMHYCCAFYSCIFTHVSLVSCFPRDY